MLTEVICLHSGIRSITLEKILIWMKRNKNGNEFFIQNLLVQQNRRDFME